jgi:Integrase core domain
MRESSLCALSPGPGLGSPVLETDHALRLRNSGGDLSRDLCLRSDDCAIGRGLGSSRLSQGYAARSGRAAWVTRWWVIVDGGARRLPTRNNAVIESWHSTLEFELRGLERFATKAQARTRVAAWIDEYNRNRKHSACGMRSPIDYERRLREQHREAAA